MKRIDPFRTAADRPRSRPSKSLCRSHNFAAWGRRRVLPFCPLGGLGRGTVGSCNPLRPNFPLGVFTFGRFIVWMTVAERILEDRRRVAERERLRREEQARGRLRLGFDPFSVEKWCHIAGPVVPMPGRAMRSGTAGFWITCRHCADQFESRGLAFCDVCMELPSEERRVEAGVMGRICAECGKGLPYRKRAGSLYCSKVCSQRSRRRLCEADNSAELPGSYAPKNEADDVEKGQ
jgi:hypothetical protein